VSSRYLLDTDICIYIRNERPQHVRARMARIPPDSLALSVITWGELLLGVQRSTDPKAARRKLAELYEAIAVLPLPREAAEVYAATRAELEAAGTPIGPNDLWIAAHAKAERLILVTNNLREFKRVKGLKVENWAA
jgi:tRNA(fMet)-specific endonuclease VapC